MILYIWTTNLNLPVVTRFLCPPDIPLNIWFPTKVSAQTSNPKTWKKKKEKKKKTGGKINKSEL